MTLSDKYSAYLPYKVICTSGLLRSHLEEILNRENFANIKIRGVSVTFPITDSKLVLKPLDTIDWVRCCKEIGTDMNDYWERFIGRFDLTSLDLENAPYLLVQWLLKNHYDVFGMIALEEAIEKKPKLPDTETLLNIALNKALVGKDRITNPDSNKIAQFIIDLLNQYEQ